jgi:class 3 adenylate cyclase
MVMMLDRATDRRAARDVVQAFFFADLCGYTEFTCRHGDLVGAELALSFHHRAGELAARERCHLVKSIGDAVMVRSVDCRRAVLAAQRILRLSELEGYPRIRAGLDIGPAVEHDGARVALEDIPGLETVGLGVRHLKGLPGLQLHAAAPV